MTGKTLTVEVMETARIWASSYQQVCSNGLVSHFISIPNEEKHHRINKYVHSLLCLQVSWFGDEHYC